MRTAFIIVREYPGSHCHATLRGPEKPWSVLATATNTSGPESAAQAVAKKAGYTNVRFALVPHCLWQDAVNGYLASRRCSAIAHIYRVLP